MPCVSLNRYIFCVMAQLAIVNHLFEHVPCVRLNVGRIPCRPAASRDGSHATDHRQQADRHDRIDQNHRALICRPSLRRT
jgi:hypothetical protein